MIKEPEINLKNKEISSIFKYISVMIEDAERMDNDLKLIKKKINLLKHSLEEIEIYFDRVSGFTSRSRIKIDYMIEYFMRQVEENRSREMDKISENIKEVEPRQAKTRVEKKVKTVTVARSEKPKTKAKVKIPKEELGIMIFLSPDVKKIKKIDDGSTSIPRRQLVPSSSEEKMVIDYLIRSNIKPTKAEYRQIYKEICRMLLRSPTNAIAIQLKTVRKNKNKIFAELLYHVKIKDKVEYADLKYIELKGVEYYRRLKSS